MSKCKATGRAPRKALPRGKPRGKRKEILPASISSSDAGRPPAAQRQGKKRAVARETVKKRSSSSPAEPDDGSTDERGAVQPAHPKTGQETSVRLRAGDCVAARRSACDRRLRSVLMGVDDRSAHCQESRRSESLAVRAREAGAFPSAAARSARHLLAHQWQRGSKIGCLPRREWKGAQPRTRAAS